MLGEKAVFERGLTATIHNFGRRSQTSSGRISHNVVGIAGSRRRLRSYVTRLSLLLEYVEAEFTEGVGAGDEPPEVRDMTDASPGGLKSGCGCARLLRQQAARAACTRPNVRRCSTDLDGKRCIGHRYSGTSSGKGRRERGAVLQRRDRISVSITERQLYLDVSGQSFDTTIVEHRFH